MGMEKYRGHDVIVDYPDKEDAAVQWAREDAAARALLPRCVDCGKTHDARVTGASDAVIAYFAPMLELGQVYRCEQVKRLRAKEQR